MKKHILFSLLFGLSFNLSAQYQLVWSDEFSGSVVDPFKWAYETGTGCPNLCGWGNNELQHYTSNFNNINVDSGYLHIIGRAEQYMGSDYTSARIKTQYRFDFTYGKIEARVKMPKGKGLWPAFWMLGSNITSVSWPQCGELDIMEHVNHSPYIGGTMHYNNNGHVFHGANVLCDVEEFHVYGLEWRSDSLIWLLDGVPYYSVYIENGYSSTEEFHHPFFILLNMAIGGTLPGPPDATTIYPAIMQVDYVRVYQLGTAVSKIELPSVTLYPNPTSDFISVETKAQLQHYSVLSVDGKQLLENVPLKNGLVDVSGLTNGLYFIVFKDEQGNLYQHKFVKQ